MLQINSLTLNLGKRTILDRLDLTLASGERALLTAPNGGGKTSLLRCITSFYSNYTGEIFLDKIDSRQLEAKTRACIIGYLPQAARLDFSITVAQFLNLSIFPLTKLAERKKAQEYLKELIIHAQVQELLHLQIHDLSLGQQRLICLLATLITKPQLLLLDEPLNYLDSQKKALVETLLEQFYQEQGCTILEVSHEARALTRSDWKIINLTDLQPSTQSFKDSELGYL
jgi:ABC-type cobalamin/Fe3+-siderophores transport system ATPase subunit